MKKTFKTLLLVAAIAPVLTGCQPERVPFKEIAQYFYEAGTYKSLDYKFVNGYFGGVNDNWGGGCSAISANINGERLVGRNMDLNISNKCAYVVKTDVKGKYPTIGLAYTFRDISPDYAEIKQNGATTQWEKVLPFFCDDVMNSEGLHIEINMRHGEVDENGKDVFGVQHTNAKAKERIYVFSLGQYIALNCKDLAEAKEYLATKVDVYNEKNYWNYCFIITDAKGNSNLLEFGNQKYYWVEPDSNGVVAQTNFYVNEECNALEKIKTGLGRYDALKEGIKTVKNKTDLYNLMDKVSFSWFYEPYATCKAEHYDPRSEIIGEPAPEGIPQLTEEFCLAPENEEFISGTLDYIHADYQAMTRNQRQNLNEFWESTFTEVVDPKNKEINVRLFENSNYLYKITFDGIEKIQSI